ncbi:MAG: GAF domain-containing protein [Anaerolineae bacterium]|nr:GAF domain-containing protein [Anaerolineae bacterium]
MSETGPIRILYMEDDVGLARLLQKKLERAGYLVDLAHDGAEGLAKFKDGCYDVLAVDQKMPNFDGIEVIRSLAKSGTLPPTIMITGTGNEQIAIEAMKLGAGDYIVKDTEGGYFDLIPSVIEQVLFQRRLIEEKEEALEALQQVNRNLALFNLMGQKFAATLDLQEIMDLLMQSATETIGTEGSSVWLQHDQGGLICRAAVRGDHSRHLVDLRLATGQGIAGWVTQTGESTIVPRAQEDPRFCREIDEIIGFHTFSVMAVPLRVRDTVIGVLELVNKVGGDFDADDLALVETLTNPAAIAIDNARLVEELYQYTQELQARNEELDAFAHTVAHDLKSPLSPIVGLARFLEEMYPQMSEEEIKESLQIIARSGNKMANIINELLLLSQVRATEVELEPLSMTGIIAECLQRLAHIIEESGAEIIVPDKWPIALGYGPWVEEVWINYLSNAIKYSGDSPRVEVGAIEQGDGMICFWVKDNGPGLKPESRKRLFTEFAQLNQTRAEGHGLGLSIVRRIVEKLGGQVGVESEGIPGKGSTFMFTLRAASEVV